MGNFMSQQPISYFQYKRNVSCKSPELKITELRSYFKFWLGVPRTTLLLLTFRFVYVQSEPFTHIYILTTDSMQEINIS